jgi:hypothetical protein
MNLGCDRGMEKQATLYPDDSLSLRGVVVVARADVG